jgi:TIR domain
MVEIKFNGFDDLEQALLAEIGDQLQQRIGSIRHPETGEFPSVSITPGPDGNLNIHVEGSDELVALVQARLNEDGDGNSESSADASSIGGNDLTQHTLPSISSVGEPKVFLSYTFADSAIAEKVANSLMAKGIDTWWAEWCINAGDSIRRKVEEGIGECTHFIVLLTPRSVVKPWVQEEIDAAFTRKLGHGIKLIPLRCELAPNELPLLLQGQLSPAVDAEAVDISQLVSDIYAISRKPALGPRPAAAQVSQTQAAPYSPAANVLAKAMVEASPHAHRFQPFWSYEEAAERTGLTVDDVRDAVHELFGLVSDHHGQRLYAEEELFVRLDKHWKPWDPAADAVTVAAALLNGSVPGEPVAIAKVLSWDARRLNPAMSYLENRKHVKALRGMSGSDFVLVTMFATDGTRRFLKSRQ